jgi:uncharacterized protein YbjT (DUF2867 family)
VLAVMDPDDIARVAVAALIGDGHAGKGYLLTGPQALTAREQVATIAEVTGRSIDFQHATPHEFARAAVQGEPRLSRRGTSDLVENITGTPPRPFAIGANATPTPSAEPHLTTHRR